MASQKEALVNTVDGLNEVLVEYINCATFVWFLITISSADMATGTVLQLRGTMVFVESVGIFAGNLRIKWVGRLA